MSAWSPEIANEFIGLAALEGRVLNQMQLQELVYIAHGWCLAVTGAPLTGDRPEALSYGPEYRRLANALASYGVDPVTHEIKTSKSNCNSAESEIDVVDQSGLDQFDRDWVARIYQEYGGLEASKLASLTRRADTPWAQVFAHGAGEYRDIPHELIRAQFVQLAIQLND